MSKITETVAELARPIAEKAGCSLWDVEYVKEGGEWYLRVYVDSLSGAVAIDQCEEISRELDPILDELDPIPGPYTFEVSSAGAERPLKRPSDFEAYMGSPVLIKLFKAQDGRKEFPGILSGYCEGRVTIDFNGQSLEFEGERIALARLRV